MGLMDFIAKKTYEEAEKERIQFIENCISYLVDGEGLIDIRSRELKVRLLDTTKIAQQRVKWQIINTLIPIALIIALGFVMAIIRKKKYSKK